MTGIQIFIVDAFCYNGEGGNGAGVVLQSDGLTREQKLAIASEVGLSEMAFVSASEVADFKIEYFTPVAEVELCGHATIATFTLLHQRGLAPKTYTIETLSGILQIEVQKNGIIWMQQCLPVFGETFSQADFATCLPGINKHPLLPIQVVSTGLKDILFPVGSMEELKSLRPDFGAMANLNELQGVVGIHAFALTGLTEPVAICRNFAPRYGIDEESATGTSNCALASYLHKYYTKQSEYQFLQGESKGSPSAIMVRIQEQDGQISAVYVGGNGRIVRCFSKSQK